MTKTELIEAYWRHITRTNNESFFCGNICKAMICRDCPLVKFFVWIDKKGFSIFGEYVAKTPYDQFKIDLIDFILSYDK